MKLIKAIVFVCMVLPLLIGGKCFFVSSFDSSNDDDEQDGLVIVVSNAQTISNEVVQSITQTLMVADIASQSAQYVNDVYVNPISYSCDNASGVVMLTANDLDNSNRVSVGDDLLLSYSNCNVDNVTANGNLKISVLDARGIDIGNFDSGTDWLISLSVNSSSFQVRTGNEVFTVSGEMVIALQFDATNALLESNITNNSLALDSGSQSVLSEMDISQFINLAIVPSSYSLTVDSLKITSDKQNGTINATTNLNPLSGIELLKLSEYFVDLHLPENGVLNISGKSSNVDVSILPDEFVSIDIDTDGDSISDAVISSTWSEMQ